MNMQQIEENCLADMEGDYMPLHNLIREFSGFDKLEPSNEEFSNALMFLKKFASKYHLKFYSGPGVVSIEKSVDELIDWIKQEKQKNGYKPLSYGIWFGKE